ncbi:hypothetical protein B0H13DRAFT_2308237 [Mycena leptocephala]|nr:hypothetical protein B0H13DRAFT_2308237 [Mycena leptocephala]
MHPIYPVLRAGPAAAFSLSSARGVSQAPTNPCPDSVVPQTPSYNSIKLDRLHMRRFPLSRRPLGPPHGVRCTDAPTARALRRACLLNSIKMKGMGAFGGSVEAGDSRTGP